MTLNSSPSFCGTMSVAAVTIETQVTRRTTWGQYGTRSLRTLLEVLTVLTPF
jgi:hypothetical protein